MILEDAGGTLTVHAFGACHPTPCDWGQVNGHTYAPDVSSKQAMAFTANYSFGFKSTVLTGHLERGMLVVESYNAFTPGDTRSDYYSSGVFRR